jgi:hypothetical protein
LDPLRLDVLLRDRQMRYLVGQAGSRICPAPVSSITVANANFAVAWLPQPSVPQPVEGIEPT